MIASACGKKTTRHRAHRRARRRLNGRATLLCSEHGKHAHQASRQSSTKCRWNESPNADDPRHFTLIRQENCDSKKRANGLRCFAICDSVPQGRLSRSEWRTVDPVAQRPGLFGSTNSRQTCITPRPDDIASHEAVKFNDRVNLAAGVTYQFQNPNHRRSG